MCHITFINFPNVTRVVLKMEHFGQRLLTVEDEFFFYFPAPVVVFSRAQASPSDMHATRRAGIDYEIKTSLDYKLIS